MTYIVSDGALNSTHSLSWWRDSERIVEFLEFTSITIQLCKLVICNLFDYV